MNISLRRRAGLTFVEVLVVVGIVVLLAALLMPTVANHRDSRVRAMRILCVNNLKQLGLSARLWSNDHDDKFPFASTNADSSLRWTNSPEVFRHFQVMSNELVTPKILLCRAERTRTRAEDFASLANSNLSYFVGLDAHEGDPRQILSGDRNLTGGVRRAGFLLVATPKSELGWSSDLHKHAGNIGLADGSVQQINQVGLRRHLVNLTNATFRLAFP